MSVLRCIPIPKVSNPVRALLERSGPVRSGPKASVAEPLGRFQRARIIAFAFIAHSRASKLDAKHQAIGMYNAKLT
jgi:hypothetical protein